MWMIAPEGKQRRAVMEMIRRMAGFVLLAGLLFLPSGCRTSSPGSVPGPGNKPRSGTRTISERPHRPEAIVKVPFGEDHGAVLVRLNGPSANNAHAVRGIRALQNGEWSQARESFKEAVRENPEDGSSQFALGVAFELLGEYPDARRAYLEADRLSAGDGDLDAQAGLRRLTLRESQDQKPSR
jgi:tetratricopeptide (TPR) repeat protein